MVNPRLLQVATELLDECGWEALSLDRIADRAGVSRATVWRAGLTRAALEQMLRQQLAADYRALMWGPLGMEGSGRERLDAALRALCEVAERNLPLLAHTDLAFHGPDLDAAGLEVDYFGPWLRILDQAAADRSLPEIDDKPRFVVALSDMVLLTYVHLRVHHRPYGWSPRQTADHLIKLVSSGYLPRGT
jgi:AcrR family transcriptional regulator